MRHIPTYELYGDLLAGGLSDSIHHETIKERSSRHDWTIRLHKHRRLGQIFLFRSSGVFLRVGEAEYTTTEPTLLTVPPETVHGFLFTEDVLGDVVSLRLDELSPAIQGQFASLSTGTDMIFTASKTANFGEAAALIEQLNRTFHHFSADRKDILATQIQLIMLYLIGTRREPTSLGSAAARPSRQQDQYIETFCSLLDDHFQDAWTVSTYAEHIGISAPHLTRLCRTHLGFPPNNLVRQRRLLEAKRLLEYTDLRIAEIAHRCGFQDAAFFNRTFKGSTGVPPQSFRKNLAQRTF